MWYNATMLGFEKWFEFKSRKQREDDLAVFNSRIFPLGEVQREKIVELLKQLAGSKYDDMTLFHYLAIKDKVMAMKMDGLDAESIRKLRKSVRNTLKRKDEDVFFDCLALCMADLKIDEELNYPNIEELKEKALDLKRI